MQSQPTGFVTPGVVIKTRTHDDNDFGGFEAAPAPAKKAEASKWGDLSKLVDLDKGLAKVSRPSRSF